MNKYTNITKLPLLCASNIYLELHLFIWISIWEDHIGTMRGSYIFFVSEMYSLEDCLPNTLFFFQRYMIYAHTHNLSWGLLSKIKFVCAVRQQAASLLCSRAVAVGGVHVCAWLFGVCRLNQFISVFRSSAGVRWYTSPICDIQRHCFMEPQKSVIAEVTAK